MTVGPRYRTFWRRLWAGYVDAFLFAPLMALDYWIWKHATPLGLKVPWFVFFSVAFPAYAIYMHGHFGQTVGKRLLRVRVIDVSGGALNMGQAFRREVINLPFSAWSHFPR